MNKSAKRISSLLLGVLMTGSVVGSSGVFTVTASAAGGRDPEKDAVVFATDAMDGNFNPFFATSATDSTIIAQTQIGMLTTDKDGQAVCGEEYPTVVLDYKETMLEGEDLETAKVTTNGNKADYTQYEFIIKNGIKFSDGTDLTIKDVLFNLYVYLDPVYMGSATIYSTDIVGLQAYRTQDPSADQNASDQTFYADARARVDAMLEYLNPKSDAYNQETEQIIADIEKTKELFRKEVEMDWSSNAGTLEAYEDDYTFTEDWQVFYFAEGLVKQQTERKPNGSMGPKKDENGKYLTSLDEKDNPLAEEIDKQRNDSAKIKEYKEKYDCTEEQAKEYIVKDFAIQMVYETYSDESKLSEVLTYWATGSNILDEFAAEAKTKYFEGKKEDGELPVKTVSGITTTQTTKDYDGKDLGEVHDVLKIVINKVDPKAIWNFSFAVAPMHYYSSEEEVAKADGVTNFGVKFADKKFFDEVLKGTKKSGLPVGAGVYMAADQRGNKTQDGTEFNRNNTVYFIRNDYFETVGDGLHNANIKYMKYMVVPSNQILHALSTGRIDFGSPNATPANVAEINQYAGRLEKAMYSTNGYGYVGVNPKYVPDIEVRRAIMKAMDTGSIVGNYYTESLADVIYRPMSKESWAYPEGVKEHESIKYDPEAKEIIALVESAGWTLGSDGIYEKDGVKLSLTFTIAGETTDHPAYSMFEEAAKLLNDCGFDITVKTDINALKSLATGALQVWAAAWSSTIDPDMYQVYHKDSTATSTKNWGYPTIFADTTGQFDEEREIIEELSLLIEEGRATVLQDERKVIYAKALDKVMELAVELPTYQRNDLVVYNMTVIDGKTLNQNPSSTAGVYDRLWEVNYLTGDGVAAEKGCSGGVVGAIIGGIVVLLAAAVVVVLKLRKAPEIVVEETAEESAVEEKEETVETKAEETVETTDETKEDNE